MSQSNANKAGWSIFDEIYYKGVMAGQPAYDNRNSLEWFREYIKNNVRSANPFKAVSDRLGSKIKVGQMYIFKYDAKYADTLDYWDSVPLIFPFKDEGETFLGLNLHYAPPKARVIIMKSLYTLISDTNMDEKTKLRLTYKKLQRLAAFRFFKPLIHRYRKDHVRSLFIKVDVRFWPVAIFLPIAKWKKENAGKVYSDYAAKVKGSPVKKSRPRAIKQIKRAKI